MSPQSKNNKTGLAVVATVSGMMRAEILKSLLQDAGIQAILDYESAGVVFGITLDGLKELEKTEVTDGKLSLALGKGEAMVIVPTD